MASYYYNQFKTRCDIDNIDYSHIQLGKLCNQGKKFKKESIPLENILTKNSTYSRGHLKKRLINDNILENKCYICNMDPVWQNKKLVMVIDHINGISNDNRIENLRLVCPNCHSQTETFAGKKPKNKCKKCGDSIYKKSKYCRKCASQDNGLKLRKYERPSKIDLEYDIKMMPIVKIGKKYDVSDNTIRKWARSYGIDIEKKKMSVPDKECPHCKKIFKTSIRNQVFCSVSCVLEHKDNRVPMEELVSIVKKHNNMNSASKEIGIGRTTLREWLISYNLPTTCQEIKDKY